MSESINSLVIEDLAFAYPDGNQALFGVNLKVKRGERVALLGPNGAGKTTLILHLNGILNSGHGRVFVADKLVDSKDKDGLKQIRSKIGIVFQDPDDQLFMPTVFEDVAFGPLNLGLSSQEAEKRAMDALERVGMSHLRERPPYKLSAGEKRAVAIATALAGLPDVLVMDEPSSNLDPRGRRRLIELLKTFEHTRLIATHDLEMVVEICPRVIVMDHGKVVVEGPTAGILGDEELMLRHGLEKPHSLKHHHPH